MIAIGTWGLLKDSLKMSLLGVPPSVDHNRVAVYLRGQPGVADVHDLHIWPLGTTETALTAHLFMPGGHPGNAFLAGLTEDLEHQFRIDHVTIQIELDDGRPASPAPSRLSAAAGAWRWLFLRRVALPELGNGPLDDDAAQHSAEQRIDDDVAGRPFDEMR